MATRNPPRPLLEVRTAYADAGKQRDTSFYSHDMRCLSFLTTEYVTPAIAADIVAMIGPYNGFNPESAQQMLGHIANDDPGALLRRLHRQTQTGPSVNTSFLQQVREATQDRIAQAEKQARRVVSDIRTIVSYHGGVPRRQEAIVGGFYMHAPVDTDKEGFARIARVGASDLDEVDLDAIDDWLLRYECGDLHEFSPGDWMDAFYQLAQETKAKAERKEMQNELRRIADRAERIEPAKGGPYAKEDLPF